MSNEEEEGCAGILLSQPRKGPESRTRDVRLGLGKQFLVQFFARG